MSKKVFCGGLPWSADDSDLSAAMSHFGAVEDAKVITDRETGKSRGFGFVTFASEEDAAQAVAAATITMDGRTVRIDHAEDKGRGGGGRRDGGGGGKRDRRGRDW